MVMMIMRMMQANHIPHIGPAYFDQSDDGDQHDLIMLKGDDHHDGTHGPPAESYKHQGPRPCKGEVRPSATEEAQI